MLKFGDVLHVELADTTLVHDLNSNIAVMQIKGVVVLPVGAEIELTDPNINVSVERVRLLATNGKWPSSVCLDVRVPESYWESRRQRG